MTVAELIALLREQDPMVEVKIILPAHTFPGQATEATLELNSVRWRLPHNGKRRVEIVTTE
jgi:hypothetical protein